MALPVAATSLPAPSTVLQAVSETAESANRQTKIFLIMKIPFVYQAKKKAGEVKGDVGGSPARGRIRGVRPMKIGRPICSPKLKQCLCIENMSQCPECQAGLTLLPSTEQARHQRYDEQNEENEEQDFRDFRGASSNATESEHGGNQRNDKKYERVVQHL